jgi:hypothetical protein
MRTPLPPSAVQDSNTMPRRRSVLIWSALAFLVASLVSARVRRRGDSGDDHDVEAQRGRIAAAREALLRR